MTCDFEDVDLGDGVFIRQSYAHLFAPFMMAFKPKGKHGFNEGPWKAAKDGVAFDISAQIEVQDVPEFNGKFGQKDKIWLTASLVRLSNHPYALVPHWLKSLLRKQ